MPSLSEGTPVALLEAAALAKPIVASRVGGIPTMVTDQNEALLVPPADVIALTAALETVLANAERARQLGTRARARVLRHFGPTSQVVATNSAYARAMQRATARLGVAAGVDPRLAPCTVTADTHNELPLR